MQLHHVGHEVLGPLIDWHQTFRMELTQRHVERDLLFIDPLKTVQREIDAFPDADSRGTHQAESVDLQRIGEPKVLLQALILFEGKWSGQIVLVRRKVLVPNEVGGQGIALVGKGVQQMAELDEAPLAGDIAQRGIVLAWQRKRNQPSR